MSELILKISTRNFFKRTILANMSKYEKITFKVWKILICKYFHYVVKIFTNHPVDIPEVFSESDIFLFKMLISYFHFPIATSP